MSYVLIVYLNAGVQEIFLPNVQNRSVSIGLERDIIGGSNGEVALSLDVFDDVWTIRPNRKVLFESPLTLTDGLRVDAKISGTNEQIAIFAEKLDVERTTFKKYLIPLGEPVTVGSNDTNSIVYNTRNLVTSVHMHLERSEYGARLIDRSKNGTFVNSKRVKGQQDLQYGDMIYVLGLKLIWLGNILAVNQPREGCIVPGLTQIAVEDQEKFQCEAPAEDDYYTRSPRRMPKLDSSTVEINKPPDPKDSPRKSLLMTIVPSLTMLIPMGLGVVFMLLATQDDESLAAGPMMFMGLVTTAAAAVLAVIWAIVNSRKEKKEAKKEEEYRQKRYSEYLNRIETEIVSKHADNRASLNRGYPNSHECMGWVAQRDFRLWERNVNHPDFLTLRLGIGAIPSLNEIKGPQQRFSMIDDELAERPFIIKNKYSLLTDVPIRISLLEHRIIGIIGARREANLETARIIAAQIAMTHSYTDVKMVFIVPHGEDWGFTKWLPHVWSEDNSIRFVANDSNSVGEVLFFLSDVIRDRTDKDGRSDSNIPHYVIFIADNDLVENEVVIKQLTASASSEESMGFTMLMLYDRMDRLPNNCTTIIQRDNEFSGVYSLDNAFLENEKVVFDAVSSLGLNATSRLLSDVKVKEAEGTGVIPVMLTFLDMYGTSDIKDVDIYRNWLENRTYESMKALIGHRGGGTPVYLDVHEKYHGPHGLVAGTTGSGKSEMLQTYILSLAVSYHPHEVGFILIDYKGGGMAESFKNLTHVAGIITNLGGNQTNRALASIRSEIMRRQAVFNEYKLKHIDGYIELYRAGKAGDPMPHLLIIADEFAELKKEQPDFVRELVSASRVGRSLGVHLILATQKPDGVVDEQIWSNTKFRVCLRVAEKADSMGMLKRPDAAYITQAGRGYFQVGNDEIYEEFQSGWSGARYEPNIPFNDEKDSEAKIINLWGKASVLGSGKKKTETDEEKKIQLDVATAYVAEIAKQHGIEAVPQVWLPPLPKMLYLEDLPDMDIDKRELAVCIGLLDDPVSQQQRPVALNFTQNNHTMVASSMAGGKTTFLQTVLFGLVTTRTPDQLHIYIADYGSRTLGVFGKLPHVGGVIYDDDPDRADKLMSMIMKELDRRKLLFASKGVGSFKAYSGLYDDVPSVIFAIDNFVAFFENNQKHEENLLQIAREAASYGIYLLITCTNASDIRNRIRQNIRCGVGIQLASRYDYEEVLGNRGDITAESGCPGRGLIKVESNDKQAPRSLEFQTALCVKSDDVALMTAALTERFEQISASWKGNTAPLIPQVPEDLTIDAFTNYDAVQQKLQEKLLPIGYDVREASIFALNPEELFCYVISGGSRTGKTNCVCLLALMSKACGHDVYIVDIGDQLSAWAKENDIACLVTVDQLYDWFSETLMPEFKRRNANIKNAGGRKFWREAQVDEKQIVILFHDYGNFLSAIHSDARGLSDFVEAMTKKGDGHKIFLAGVINRDDPSIHSIHAAFAGFVSWKDGIHFGGQLDNQRILEFDIPSIERMKKYPAGYGYATINGQSALIVTPEI